MSYILDTNICIYIIKKRPPAVLERFKRLAPEEAFVSVVTVFELSYGAERSVNPERNHAALKQFFLPFTTLELIPAIAETYGRVRHSLKHNQIGDLDLLIAAQALHFDMTVVTNNEREFRRVAGLKVENWVS